MKNIKYLLKAVVILGIVFAFVAPGAAMLSEYQVDNKLKAKLPSTIKTTCGMNPGWVEQASNFWEPSRGINFICAIDENIVWASGYDGSGSSQPVQEFTKTLNGGTEWKADTISSAPIDGYLAMIYALDENYAWVPIHSGDPQGIWNTSDGGNTWTHQDTAAFSGSGAFPNVVHFWDTNDGWCQGDPVDGYFELYTTTDGGTTWTRTPTEDIPAPLANEMGTVGYYDVVSDTIWWGTQCSTNPGRIFKSTDRGYSWTVADTPFPNSGWVDVRMRDANNGLAMDKRSTASYLAETSDGGATWTEITPSGPFYGYDIQYVPGTANTWISTGAALGNSGASYSFDGGHNWVDYPEVTGTQLLACDFVEGFIGWAGSFSQDEETGGVYKYILDVNLPPDAPIINGPTSGTAGIKYDYTFKAYDFEDDDIAEFVVNWGDNTADETITGPFAAGEEVTASHKWDSQGNFVIKATAEDVNGGVGPEGSFFVTMPRNKAVYRPLFLQFLENHPNLFPILRQLLGL